MSSLAPVRGRWGFLQTLHPLFFLAESLPTIERADQGYYGSTAVNDVDVDHLKNEITMLRNDLKLNIIKQKQVDIDQLTEDDPAFERLELDLQTLLEDLELLIDSQVFRHEEFDVRSKKAYLSSLGTQDNALIRPSLPLGHIRARIYRLLSQARRVAKTPTEPRESCTRLCPRWIHLSRRCRHFSFDADEHHFYTHGIELE